jgi:hypothetical protein
VNYDPHRFRAPKGCASFEARDYAKAEVHAEAEIHAEAGTMGLISHQNKLSSQAHLLPERGPTLVVPAAGWNSPLNTPRRFAQRRELWLAAALATCAAAYMPTAASAGDARQDSSYVVLSGDEARKFLVGNSVEDSPAMMEGSGAAPGVRYLVNENSVLDGELNRGACFVTSWEFRGDSYCMGSPADLSAQPDCRQFHLLVSKRARTNQAKLGDLIGYVAYRDIKGDVPDPRFDDAILKGNMTACPLLGESRPAKPLKLSTALSHLVAPDDQASLHNDHGSSGVVILQLLIGNSVYWPPGEQRGCGRKEYYSPDGRVFSAECGRDDASVSKIAVSHWKIVKGHFCLQDRDDHDAFSNCDSITVLRAPSVRAQLHVYYRRETESPQPGLIMQGNPAGFRVQKQ